MVLPFHQDTTFFFIPYYGNNDNPCYNDTLRKERELSLLPSSTVYCSEKKKLSELHSIDITIIRNISMSYLSYFICIFSGLFF